MHLRCVGARVALDTREMAMPDFILIFVGSLVPIGALMLALASGEARVGEVAGMPADPFGDVGIEGPGDDARS